MIKNHDLPGHHELQIRHHQIIRIIVCDIFEVSNYVITEITNCTASKPREMIEHWGSVFLHDFSHQFDGVPFQCQNASVIDTIESVFCPNDTLEWIRPYERISGCFSITFHALQQKRVTVSRTDSVKGCLRRFIRQFAFVPDRNQRELRLPIILHKCFVGCSVHDYDLL